MTFSSGKSHFDLLIILCVLIYNRKRIDTVFPFLYCKDVSFFYIVFLIDAFKLPTKTSVSCAVDKDGIASSLLMSLSYKYQIVSFAFKELRYNCFCHAYLMSNIMIKHLS